VAGFNDLVLRVAKFEGQFVWHRHDETDELFLVMSGRLVMMLRDEDVVLGPRDLLVVPRGVEHCPRAEGEVEVLLLEPQKGQDRSTPTDFPLGATAEEVSRSTPPDHDL
jgi:mannose-6-phosphate isomerase-like protein (cupin superfamily)